MARAMMMFGRPVDCLPTTRVDERDYHALVPARIEIACDAGGLVQQVNVKLAHLAIGSIHDHPTVMRRTPPAALDPPRVFGVRGRVTMRAAATDARA